MRRIEIFKGHTDRVACMIQTDVESFMSGDLDRNLKIWDVMQRTCLASYKVSFFF